MPATQQYVAPLAPAIISPVDGGLIAGTSIFFRVMEHSLEATSYQIEVGSAVGLADYEDSGLQPHPFTGSTFNLFNGTGLSSGDNVFVRLSWIDSGITTFIDYTYTVADFGIQTPRNGATMPFGNLPVLWDQYQDFSYEWSVSDTATTTVLASGTKSYPDNQTQVNILPVGVALTRDITVTVEWVDSLSVSFATANHYITLDTSLTPMPYQPNNPGGTVTLRYPAIINLFQDGTEVRLTTSNNFTVATSFEGVYIKDQHGHMARYVAQLGRNSAMIPYGMYTMKFDRGNWDWTTEEELPWAFRVASKFIVEIPAVNMRVLTDVTLLIPSSGSSIHCLLVEQMFTHAFIEDKVNEVIVTPCQESTPDFNSVEQHDKSFSTWKVTTTPVSTNVEYAPLVVTRDLLTDLVLQGNTVQVLPLLAIPNAGKVTQTLEKTTGVHKPSYYPVGGKAKEILAYTYTWSSWGELNSVINLFEELKGQQKSLFVCGYTEALDVVDTTGLEVSVTGFDLFLSPENISHIAVIEYSTGDPVKIVEVTAVVASDSTYILTVSNSLAQYNLDMSDCKYMIVKATPCRLSNDSLTLTHHAGRMGTCALQFIEVIT